MTSDPDARHEPHDGGGDPGNAPNADQEQFDFGQAADAAQARRRAMESGE